MHDLKDRFVFARVCGVEGLGADDYVLVETAARALCGIRGIDPEKMEQEQRDHGDGATCDVYIVCPVWMNIAREMRALFEGEAALAMTLQQLDARFGAARQDGTH